MDKRKIRARINKYVLALLNAPAPVKWEYTYKQGTNEYFIQNQLYRQCEYFLLEETTQIKITKTGMKDFFGCETVLIYLPGSDLAIAGDYRVNRAVRSKLNAKGDIQNLSNEINAEIELRDSEAKVCESIATLLKA
jgi:hypothetical protein